MFMIIFLVTSFTSVEGETSAKTPVLEETNTFFSDNLSIPLPILSSNQITVQQQQEEQILATGFFSGSMSYTLFQDSDASDGVPGYSFTSATSFSGPMKQVLDINRNIKYIPVGTWTVSCNVFENDRGVVRPFHFTGSVDSSMIGMSISAAVFIVYDDSNCSIFTDGQYNNVDYINYPNGTVLYTNSYSHSDPAYLCESFFGCSSQTLNINYVLHPVNTNNNPPNPIIDVSPSDTVESGTTVTLDASRSSKS